MGYTPSEQALLVSTNELIVMLGISRTTLWEMEKRNELPKAIFFNVRCKRWRRADIEAFIERQAA